LSVTLEKSANNKELGGGKKTISLGQKKTDRGWLKKIVVGARDKSKGAGDFKGRTVRKGAGFAKDGPNTKQNE